MYRKTYYATDPASVHGATNDQLRERYRIADLFASDEIRLNYTHYERLVIGGAAPVREPVLVPVHQEPASAKDKPFLERREMGVVNVGAAIGFVNVDGQRYELNPKTGCISRWEASTSRSRARTRATRRNSTWLLRLLTGVSRLFTFRLKRLCRCNLVL